MIAAKPRKPQDNPVPQAGDHNRKPTFRELWASIGRAKQLTPRQFQLYMLIGQGKSPKQAARIMGITIRTVKFHIVDIRQRLKAAGWDQIALRVWQIHHELYGR